MNSAHGLTAENLLRALPDVLKNDESMAALAASIAQVLAARPEEIQRLAIYPRIDELPEDLLDILAYDFKVDWYNYNYPIQVKRDLIKSSFEVHRYMGTRKAVSDALSAIYPGSTVEEWFEYGGEPYYFRIILDVTEQRVAFSNEEILRAVNLYKSLRSHLENNAIGYRSRSSIIIKASSGYVFYAVRLCGTYPARATEGKIYDENLTLLTDADSLSYSAPRSGAIDTGTYPTRAVDGRVYGEDISVAPSADGVAYATAKSGTYPAISTQGSMEPGGINAALSVDGVAYSSRMCGTAPGNLL